METREIMIVRHAKSSWSNQSLSDIQRPLNSRGEQDAIHMAHWIKSKNFRPQLMLSSPARRARQTAESIQQKIGLTPTALVFSPPLYLASLDTLLKCIRETGDELHSIMLVGHNPGLEELVQYLCDDPLPYTSDNKLLTTANFVLIHVTGAWHDVGKGSGNLIAFMRPKQLK